MKRKSLKLVVSFILVTIASCNEPETVVTDIVHPDGSVTRKIEMKSTENNITMENIPVPFDSTWTIRDSLEISEKGDTVWVKRAEKLFANTAEINNVYLADSGVNKDISRKAEFRKLFRWFNTEYRFAEIIDKKMLYGYPLDRFLDQEEMKYFFSPDAIKNEKKQGPDSTKYKVMEDTINVKTNKWLFRSMVSEWIEEFSKLIANRAGADLSEESLKSHEDEYAGYIAKNGDKFDSLWSHGVVLRDFIGEANAVKFKNDADSAMNIVEKRTFFDFTKYSVKFIMPGNLIGTNGLIDSNRVMQWPVQDDFFRTRPYEMWAESKTTNLWAWIVTGIFLLFVGAGLVFRWLKK
jgi:hypothetical protein